MKIRKKRKDEPGKAFSSAVEYHTVNCCGCGKFLKKIKKQEQTISESFECPRCTSRFSLIFPGTEIDEARARWLRGEGDEFTDFKLRPRRRK